MSSGPDTDVLALPIKRWSPEEFDALSRSGVLKEDDRVELLEGLLVQMTPPGPAHTNVVARLTSMLAVAAKGRALVSPQSPLDCGSSRPQPDVALLPLSEDRPDRLPRKALLVVEVSESSVTEDRIKASIYARAGIPEYWLVNLQDQTLEVHTQPVRRGKPRYRSVNVLGPGDALRTPALPKFELAVSRLFVRSH